MTDKEKLEIGLTKIEEGLDYIKGVKVMDKKIKIKIRNIIYEKVGAYYDGLDGVEDAVEALFQLFNNQGIKPIVISPIQKITLDGTKGMTRG